jgi:hypothetical protein
VLNITLAHSLPKFNKKWYKGHSLGYGFFVYRKVGNMGQFEFYIHELDDVVMCEICGVRPAVVRGLVYPREPYHMCLECAERESEVSHERYVSFAPTNSK